MLDKIIDALGLSNKKVSLLGSIELEVLTSKTVDLTIETTNRRVEKGFIVSDTSRVNPEVIDLEVVDNSKTYLINKEELKKLARKGEPTTFTYAAGDTYENVVIENITDIYSSEQKEGMTYWIRLKKIIQAEQVKKTYKMSDSSTIPSGTSKQVATSANATADEASKVKKRSGLLGMVGDLK
ncbi:MAG: phage baseplate protein [Cetobacterium sp.]|uniref:phage baseplate protein n=1 Tax=Cetobacterium sp. TaxID=2071632 RepID=UPI003F366D46